MYTHGSRRHGPDERLVTECQIYIVIEERGCWALAAFEPRNGLEETRKERFDRFPVCKGKPRDKTPEPLCAALIVHRCCKNDLYHVYSIYLLDPTLDPVISVGSLDPQKVNGQALSMQRGKIFANPSTHCFGTLRGTRTHTSAHHQQMTNGVR